MGNAGTSAEWIERIEKAVDKLAHGKSLVVVRHSGLLGREDRGARPAPSAAHRLPSPQVDGVGFPAVGSVVGVSNAEVAKAARAPVLIVGKSGVGGAIDAFSLNSTFFASNGVPVCGAVFNRGALDGFYEWRECKFAINQWFRKARRREEMFGVVPELPALDGAREQVGQMAGNEVLDMAEANISHVAAHVDVEGLVRAASADPWNRVVLPSVPRVVQCALGASLPAPPSEAAGKMKSRDEIEAAAALKGAKGG